ncbi:hypothetical protein BT96DRAFT_195117, partial [Gymnopus androsaceus JB14]
MPSTLKKNQSFTTNLSNIDGIVNDRKFQRQRLENLNWRAWHLQKNIMVDTNANSNREYKEKERGAEHEAPSIEQNQRANINAIETEHSREAIQSRWPEAIKHMQFTFSLDQPDPIPFPEFNKRTPAKPDEQISVLANNDKEPCVAERHRREDLPLRFPPLFSSDFGPAALLSPAPTLTAHINYGEGPNAPNAPNNDGSDGFSILRPTIELPLNKLNRVDGPRPWSPLFFASSS